ncbi:MAG: LiaF transmembrane domain-containing protein [Chloroflexota bacterium]
MSERIDQLKEEEKAALEAQTMATAGNVATVEESAVEREEQRGWILGLVLIGLGVLFLLNNFFNITLIDNWWALFILIPAGAKLNRAWSRYQSAGRWTADARGSLVGGLLISAIAFIFLFNLSFGLFWPVLLIILGVGLLLKVV